MSIWDLLEAFDLVCKATGTVKDISRILDDTPIDLYQIEILHRLQTEGPMTFERIFESKTNRVVMVGLFLALLELIREKLIWADQSISSSIYLRPLTEEPAEHAVQEAILATEVGGEKSDQAEQQKRPPIPITELPPKRETPVPLEARQQQSSAIPITELPPKSDSAISSQEQEKKEALPAKDHKQQTAG